MQLVFSVVRGWHVQRAGFAVRDGVLYADGAPVEAGTEMRRLYRGSALPWRPSASPTPAGKFDAEARLAPGEFESRFGAVGLDTELVLVEAARPYVCGPTARFPLPAGAAGLPPLALSRLPPDLLYAVATGADLGGTLVRACYAVWRVVAAASGPVAARLRAEAPRRAVVAGWYAIGYGRDGDEAAPDALPRAAGADADARAAARILAVVAAGTAAGAEPGGLDAAALAADEGLRWTVAVALTLFPPPSEPPACVAPSLRAWLDALERCVAP